MSQRRETPFDTIEGAYGYVTLLSSIIEEQQQEIEGQISEASADRAERRKDALKLVSFNMAKLHRHITESRRILNDLRTLRRLLLSERGLEELVNERV